MQISVKMRNMRWMQTMKIRTGEMPVTLTHLLFGTADSHSLAWPWHPIFVYVCYMNHINPR